MSRTAQPGIFAQGTRSHHYLELTVRPDAKVAALRQALRRLREPGVTAGGLNLVVAFGPSLYRRLHPDDAPADLGAFEAVGVAGGTRGVPAVQRDLWLWLHGTGADVVLDGARLAAAALMPVAEVALEQPAHVYRDGRDMTGFIDGTENPPVQEAPEVALVPDGPGAGGSHMVVIRWVHDLAAFEALSLHEQQQVIGRTKVASEELEDKEPTAHIARVVIEEDGEELEIYRRSTPFGTVGEQGLYFVAFSADPSRFTKMLHRMYGVEDGVRDRLTDFSRPTTGGHYFAPSLQALEQILET